MKVVKHRRSTNHTWQCWTCKEEFSYSAFVSALGEQWYDEVYAKVIKPGKLRVCRKCSTLQTCQKCQRVLPENEYSTSRWKNRHQQKSLCKMCAGEAESHRCDCCGVVKGRKSFDPSMWKQRFRQGQRCLCLECCNPPCTSPDCVTCKTCRSIECKAKQCTKVVKPLHPTHLPKELKDLKSWLCGNRRHICSLCNKVKAATDFPTSMLHNRKRQPCFCFECCNPQCMGKCCKTC